MIKVNCGGCIVFKSIEDFSELFGISVKTIQSWLNRESKPRKSHGIKSIEYNDIFLKF